jgi:hypothetical protein
LQASFIKSASDMASRAETLANTASSSVAAANTQAADFRKTLSAGNTLDTAYGADDRTAIGKTYAMVDQAATALQNRFGFERSVAESYASEAMFSGSFNTGLGLPSYGSGRAGGAVAGGGAGGRVGVGVTTTGSKRSTSSGQASARDGLSEVKGFLQNQSKTQNWGQQRDSFFRAPSAIGARSTMSAYVLANWSAPPVIVSTPRGSL